MDEQWRAVPNYVGIYEVSDMGRVKRVAWSHTNHGVPVILRLQKLRFGYKRIGLSKNGRTTRFQVHRLVMATFLGESNLSVNHKNGDPSDNRLCNLEYLAMVDNLKDSWRRGTRIGLNQGSKHGMHKITEDIAAEIRKRGDNKQPQREIAAMFGVSVPTVSMIIRRKTWRHIS